MELDIDPEEFDVMEPRIYGSNSRAPLLQFTDHLVNGAGFCRVLAEQKGGVARISELMRSILEDATVPRSELAKMIRFVAEVARKHRLKIGTFGHMGDGNLHPTFLTDERNKDEMHRVEVAFREIFEEAIRLGGTITGEHGVGLAKKSFLPSFAGEPSMRLMRQLRRVMDPNGILNPGKMFD